MTTKFWVLSAMLVLLTFTSGCTLQKSPTTTSPEKKTTPEQLFLQLVVSDGTQEFFNQGWQVKKGKNAFDAMKEKVKVDYKQFSFGVFVEKINGVAPPSQDFYWALFVNGEYSEKGISDISLNEDTVIEWRLVNVNEYFPGEDKA
jgi:hypothetical protein